MESSDLTPREYYAQIKANPNRAKFGFGRKPILINIDLQIYEGLLYSRKH